MSSQSKIEHLYELVKSTCGNLSFSIVEIGALPLEGQSELFHDLLDFFPESQITAFEIDHKLCEELNNDSHPNIQYFPVALGRVNEECPFYKTIHPMCCSLYRPNEELIKNYVNLDVAMLESVGSINTITLDDFAQQNDIKDIDFIKIDIQGAELDVFMGGEKTLKAATLIVSEVEFIPLYINQPLFGDVCQYLVSQDFMFHKFIGIAGRTISPIVLNDDPNYASQHMWSDAIFMRDITKISNLSPIKLLKMGILAFMYGSIDVAFSCFCHYDKTEKTSISQAILEL